MVSGTPLGLRDMTVISQITDRWRAGPVGPRCSHSSLSQSSRCHLNIQEKQTLPTLTETSQASQASQCNLHLPLTLEYKLPSGRTVIPGMFAGERQIPPHIRTI